MYSTEEAKTMQDKLTNIITELEEVAQLANYSWEYNNITTAQLILQRVKKYTFDNKNYILKVQHQIKKYDIIKETKIKENNKKMITQIILRHYGNNTETIIDAYNGTIDDANQDYINEQLATITDNDYITLNQYDGDNLVASKDFERQKK